MTAWERCRTNQFEIATAGPTVDSPGIASTGIWVFDAASMAVVGHWGAAANYHSVKNRFLLRINNGPVREFRRLPTLARDLVVLGGCVAFERSSLPAFSWLAKNRRRLLAKRAEIRARRGAAANPGGSAP